MCASFEGIKGEIVLKVALKRRKSKRSKGHDVEISRVGLGIPLWVKLYKWRIDFSLFEW